MTQKKKKKSTTESNNREVYLSLVEKLGGEKGGEVRSILEEHDPIVSKTKPAIDSKQNQNETSDIVDRFIADHPALVRFLERRIKKIASRLGPK